MTYRPSNGGVGEAETIRYTSHLMALGEQPPLVPPPDGETPSQSGSARRGVRCPEEGRPGSRDVRKDRRPSSRSRVVLPDVLSRLVRDVIAAVPAATESYDRRGFFQYHWPSPLSEAKPFELSLEYEGLMRPADDAGLGRLAAALHWSEGRLASEVLLPGLPEAVGWVVRRHARQPGPQSVDVYFDSDGGTVPMVTAGYTVRGRVKAGSFMTWRAAAGARTIPMNCELPCVRSATPGLIARLEFNWLAPVLQSDEYPVTPGVVGTNDEPLALLSRLWHLDVGHLVPVTEQTTLRLKFGLAPLPGGAENQDRIVINMDYITARSYANGATARFVDVDVSSTSPATEDEIALLVRAIDQLRATYALVPRIPTKVARALALLTP